MLTKISLFSLNAFPIADAEIPRVSGCPDDVIVSNIPTTNQGSFNWRLPTIIDNVGLASVDFTCSGLQWPECDQAGVGTFPLGDTLIAYDARDTSGNQATCSFTVTVIGMQLNTPLMISELLCTVSPLW